MAYSVKSANRRLRRISAARTRECAACDVFPDETTDTRFCRLLSGPDAAERKGPDFEFLEEILEEILEELLEAFDDGLVSNRQTSL